MTIFELVDWLPRLLRKRKRTRVLQEAANWPVITAKIVKATVVPKDFAADEGSVLQSSQVEAAFYFTQNGDFHGGHLRSVPVSDAEAHRLLTSITEDTSVRIRCNPSNPSQNHTLAEDNQDVLPFPIWPM